MCVNFCWKIAFSLALAPCLFFFLTAHRLLHTLFFVCFFGLCLDKQALSEKAQVCLCGVCVRWALFSSGLSPLRGSQFCQQEIQTDLNLPHGGKKTRVRQQAQTSPRATLPNPAFRGFLLFFFFNGDYWKPVCFRIYSTATHAFACLNLLQEMSDNW